MKIDHLTKQQVIDKLKVIRAQFEVAIYSSENYFNTGSILRTGHGYLCSKFWMIDFNKFYKKATMGCHKYENISKVSLEEFITFNKNRNIISFERRPELKTKEIYDFTYPNRPILFFGSEKTGVPNEILDVSKEIITIPMYGVHNDFNVAVAASVVMYDFTSKNRIVSFKDCYGKTT